MVIADLKTARGEYEIRIDGIKYTLIGPSELTLRDTYLIAEANERLLYLQVQLTRPEPKDGTRSELIEHRNGLKAVMAEASQQIDRCLAPVFSKVPAKVLRRLTEVQKKNVVDLYMRAIAQERQVRTDRATEQGGESPFPGDGPG
jgi:hypothetical protein